MSLAPPTSDTSTSLAALLERAAFARLEDLGWITVSGPDRVRWLNGMVTNNIATLQPGQGCYCFVLSAQGRIQADLHAFATPGVLLLETGRSRIPALIELLDRFLIMDEVELAAESTEDGQTLSGLLVAGPEAAALLAGIGLTIAEPGLLSFSEQLWQGHAVRVIRGESPLVPRFEVWAPSAGLPILERALLDAGVEAASSESIEQLRLLEGTPRFGLDLRDRDLPQETGQSARALHFSKGCYLGQEIVERIHSRGNVHRTFVRFALEGELPATPAPLAAGTAPDKPVGEVTSVAYITRNGRSQIFGLGFLRRETLERGEALAYPGGRATPITLAVSDALGSQQKDFPGAASSASQPLARNLAAERNETSESSSSHV